MSRTAPCGALIAIMMASLVASCARPASPAIGPYTLLDAKFPITINFTCNGGVNTIGLTDAANHQAWSVSANKGEAIRWRVPPNVTINSIKPKPGGTLPVVTNGQQGGNDGDDYNGTVDNGAGSGAHYPYAIDVTCKPSGGGTPVKLVIDPDMIIL